MMTTGLKGRALAALLLAAGALGAQAEERYWITELGTAEAYPDYWTTRINASGEIAMNLPTGAVLVTNGTTIALGRSGASTVIDLNDQGQVIGVDDQGIFFYDPYAPEPYVAVAGMSAVVDLSNSGVVAGTMYDSIGYGHAAVWYAGTAYPIYELLQQQGEIASETLFVNSWGEAVGYWYDASWTRYPFFFHDGELVSGLDPITDLVWSEDQHVTALNDSGMVAGFYWNTPQQYMLAYSWFGYPMDIAADFQGARFDYARGLNERNDVFGNAWDEVRGVRHGFLFTYEDWAMHDVGSFGGDTCLHGINDRGEIVGHSNEPGNGPYLGDADHFAAGPNFIYTGGKIYDLNTLVPQGSGFVLASYNGKINDLGQLVMNAWDVAAGVERAILLTPLPVTSIAFSGATNAAGWYAPSVTVALNATDAATGVGRISYRVDSGTWVNVTGSSVTFQIPQSGTHRISYYAVDAKGHAEAVKYATVSVDRGGVIIDQATLPGATTGTRYSQKLSAHGGTTPYTYRISAGSLPAGLTLALDGTISGTPTAVGLSRFQVQASSRTGPSGRSSLEIEVLAPLQGTMPSTLYWGSNVGLTAAGGRAPYTWAVSASTPLPQGVSIHHASLATDGSTPSGEYPVTFEVTDDRGQVATQAVTLSF
jgi:hypothetical protein